MVTQFIFKCKRCDIFEDFGPLLGFCVHPFSADDRGWVVWVLGDQLCPPMAGEPQKNLVGPAGVAIDLCPIGTAVLYTIYELRL